MQVDFESQQLSAVEHELNVSVPAEEMSTRIASRFAEVAAHAQLPGFRPGKIPKKILVDRFGPAVTEEAVNQVLQEAYRDALDKSSLQPVSPGEMSDITFEPGSPLKFKVKIEVLPPIEVPELETVTIELKEPQADEEDVDNAVESLRESQAVLVPTDDPVDEHSVITFDMQELDESGVALIGKSQKDVSIDMSRQRFGEEFATKLTGLACEEKAVVEFQRAGATENVKPLKAEITIRNIQKKELPQVDDDFARSVNPTLESVAMLRDDLRKYIEARAGYTARQEMFRKLADELLRRSEFPVPPRMLEDYLDKMADQAVHSSHGKHDDDAIRKFKEEYRTAGIWNLRWYLLRNQIIRAFDLRVTKEDLEQEYGRMATIEDEFADDFKKKLTDAQKMQIHDDLQERKVLNHLESKVQIQRASLSLAQFEGRAGQSSLITL
ncbi:trigger factor [bacterium]|nr:trigger factor [bacterium]